VLEKQFPVLLPDTNPQSHIEHTSPTKDIDSAAEDEFPMDDVEEEEIAKLLNQVSDSFESDFNDSWMPKKSFASKAYLLRSGGLEQPISYVAFQSFSKESDCLQQDLTYPQAIRSAIRMSNPGSDRVDSIKQSKHANANNQCQNGWNSSQAEISLSVSSPPTMRTTSTVPCSFDVIDKLELQNHADYEPLKPFVRHLHPPLVPENSPILGLSSQACLKVCFRIGEMFKVAKTLSSRNQDVMIELFARVKSSVREPGTTKQHFVFVDLWQDNSLNPEGVLMDYKPNRLAETENKAFLNIDKPKMAICLGRLKTDTKNKHGWRFHLINIRETDWEEIRYVKCVVDPNLQELSRG
jgi:hypothetical protein